MIYALFTESKCACVEIISFPRVTRVAICTYYYAGAVQRCHVSECVWQVMIVLVWYIFHAWKRMESYANAYDYVLPDRYSKEYILYAWDRSEHSLVFLCTLTCCQLWIKFNVIVLLHYYTQWTKAAEPACTSMFHFQEVLSTIVSIENEISMEGSVRIPAVVSALGLDNKVYWNKFLITFPAYQYVF